MIIAIVPAPGHEALVAEGPSVDGCVPERPMTIDVLRPGSRHPCVDGCLMNLFRVPPLDLSGLKPGDECPACYDRGLVSVPALVLHAPGDPKLGVLRAMEAAEVADGNSVDLCDYGSFSGPARLGGVESDADGCDVRVWGVGAEVPEWVAPWSSPGRAFALAHLLVQRGIAAEVIVLPADEAKETQ